MIYHLEDKEHLVLVPVNISKDDFLNNAKVLKNSYFYKLLEKIYLGLTVPSVDLEKYQKTYYSEYDTFEEFLYKKYPSLNDEELKFIHEKLRTKKYILLMGHMDKFTDYNYNNLIEFSKKFMLIIESLLKAENYEN